MTPIMEQLHLPAYHQAKGEITLPGSKSISNRTLLLAALAQGDTVIRDLLTSDDTARMLEALETLGVSIEDLGNHAWRVRGCAGQFPQKQASLFLGNAGTAFRPLTAALAFSGGEYQLHGVARMHERPIGDLVTALQQIGAKIQYTGQAGYPPLHISPPHLSVSQSVSIRGDVSSQFLTALLMALPLTGQATRIDVIGELISKPYIAITLNLMARFGVTVKQNGWQSFELPAHSHYVTPSEIYVEGDASSASYFIAAGILAGDLTIKGVGQQSIQGDIAFAAAAEMMGGKIQYGTHHIQAQRTGPLKAIDLDCNHIPDAAMTLAVMAMFAQGTTTLRNIASWRVKETDRIAAMATELRKVGAIVVEGADFIQITPPTQLIANAVIDTYDDHRMAMCFSLLSLGGIPIKINDPKCVAKTFPEYFKVFQHVAS